VTSGTLIIWGVDALSPEQQRHLLAWMTGAGANVQIISISERQLFPRVWQKAFLDDLYYRLNMVCLALDDRPADSRTTRL
jgi:DNA-binding NtrC family response regulator